MDKEFALHRLFLGAMFLAFAFSTSCQRQFQPQQPEIQETVSTLKPFPATVSPQLRKLVESAVEQTKITTGYDPSYVRITYPGGDVPIETGVCSDVVVHTKPQSKRDAQISAAVRAVVEAQKDAWNRGDIGGYMDGYARSRNTILVSGDNVTRGWQTVHDRYQKNYNSREKMGMLTFSDLEVTVMSKDAAVMIGRWHLQRANDEPHGRFTLIFRNTKQGWKIVHDHTSSAAS